MDILKIKNLHVHYGAIKAVQNLSMSIKKGSIVTLIGANGAGKAVLYVLLQDLIALFMVKLPIMAYQLLKNHQKRFCD